jgi:hypothetical protein
MGSGPVARDASVTSTTDHCCRKATTSVHNAVIADIASSLLGAEAFQEE